ncbi:MAG TPA: glycoside hydrolase family 32 protein [Fimbriimonadaceae bacterium]|nr:glycoside hydrolase family 32 protein [Fimbriimonadaceae bacterium]
MLLPLADLMQSPDYQEPLRPQFHFTAKRGWLNDPNGLVYAKGEYHLFFQHNPFGTNWGNMTWGHAVSKDLVHWKQLPNAIEPDDRGTIYSGSAVTDPSNTSGLEADLIALYTSAGGNNDASKGKPFTQSLAFSRDNGRTWTKHPRPIIGHIEAENRDPKVDWHEPTKHWIMALYLNRDDFAIFRSRNLVDWQETQRVSFPGSNECPDFFEMNVEGSRERKWVFTGANGRYWVGSFDGMQFRPEQEPLQVEFGANNYAVQSYYGLPQGRRVQIGWMRDGHYPNMPFNQQMTFPCDLTLKKVNGLFRLHRFPVKEIESIWTKGDAPGDLLDLECSFKIGKSVTRVNVNGVTVSFDPATSILSVLGRGAYLEPEKGRLSLRMLVDRTSIEVFGNGGRVSLSMCKQPSTPSKPSVEGANEVKIATRVLRSAWR